MADFRAEIDTRFVKRRHRGFLGCFGWLLVICGGFFLMTGPLWNAAVDWIVLALGLYFIFSSVRFRDGGQFFPGIILITLAGALLARKYGYLEFQDWQFWSLLFFGAGLGFLSLWITRTASRWVIVPGGVFLIAAGMGFGCRSFWWYQRLLRNLCDFWPLLIAFIGVAILLKRWKKNRRGNPDQHLDV